MTQIEQLATAGESLTEWTVRCDCGWRDPGYAEEDTARMAAVLHQLAGAMAGRATD